MRIAALHGDQVALFERGEGLPIRFSGGVDEIYRWLKEKKVDRIGLLAPHGGPNHFKPSLISKELLEEIAPFSGPLPLAERLVKKPLAEVQLLLFDTAFYHTLPLESATLGVTKELAGRGIRRYGIHGYGVQSIAELGKPEGRTVVAFLAKESAAVALLDGVAIDTRANLLSWERAGVIAPSLVLRYPEIAMRGGIKEIAGTQESFDELVKETPHKMQAMLAFETYALEVKKAIGALAASLGGIDTLVFTGEWGERYPELRREIAGGLEFLGIELDPKKNDANSEDLTFGNVKLLIIPSREEEMIKRDVASFQPL